MKHDEQYDIPVKGSLGLLAIGYVGLQLWRKKRAEYEKEHGKYINFFVVKKPDTNQSNPDEHSKKTD